MYLKRAIYEKNFIFFLVCTFLLAYVCLLSVLLSLHILGLMVQMVFWSSTEMFWLVGLQRGAFKNGYWYILVSQSEPLIAEYLLLENRERRLLQSTDLHRFQPRVGLYTAMRLDSQWRREVFCGGVWLPHLLQSFFFFLLVPLPIR